MPAYAPHLREEELKNRVAADVFGAFDCARILGAVDFCVSVKVDGTPLWEPESLLWAEAKAGDTKQYTGTGSNKTDVAPVFLTSGETGEKTVSCYDGEKGNNVHIMCMFHAIRHCIEADWLTHYDQFLYPSDSWANDVEFQLDCLAYTLFHEKNRISCGVEKHTDLLPPNGVRGDVVSRVSGEQIRVFINHWIPFAESEVDAKDAYQSHFMVEFLRRVGDAASGRVETAGYRDPGVPAPSQGLLFGGAHGFGEERGGRRNPEAECNASREIGLRAEEEEEKDLRPVSTSDAKQTSLPLRSAETPRFKPLAGEPPAPPEPLAAQIAPKVREHGFLRSPAPRNPNL